MSATISQDDVSQTPKARRGRRVSDKVLIAFHAACDVGEYNVARQLLSALESLVNNPARPVTGERRREVESLVAAHERLWHLVVPFEN